MKILILRRIFLFLKQSNSNQWCWISYCYLGPRYGRQNGIILFGIKNQCKADLSLHFSGAIKSNRHWSELIDVVLNLNSLWRGHVPSPLDKWYLAGIGRRQFEYFFIMKGFCDLSPRHGRLNCYTHLCCLK